MVTIYDGTQRYSSAAHIKADASWDQVMDAWCS
jgi:hypothetical protein